MNNRKLQVASGWMIAAGAPMLLLCQMLLTGDPLYFYFIPLWLKWGWDWSYLFLWLPQSVIAELLSNVVDGV
jgi:hypothetical protein